MICRDFLSVLSYLVALYSHVLMIAFLQYFVIIYFVYTSFF